MEVVRIGSWDSNLGDDNNLLGIGGDFKTLPFHALEFNHNFENNALSFCNLVVTQGSLQG